MVTGAGAMEEMTEAETVLFGKHVATVLMVICQSEFIFSHPSLVRRVGANHSRAHR
jgi:hypothetical protein